MKRLLSFASLAVLLLACGGKGGPTSPTGTNPGGYPGPDPLPPTIYSGPGSTWENPDMFFDCYGVHRILPGQIRITMILADPGIGSNLYNGLHVNMKFKVELAADIVMPPTDGVHTFPYYFVYSYIADEAGTKLTVWPSGGLAGQMSPGETREFSFANTVYAVLPVNQPGLKYAVRIEPLVQGTNLYAWRDGMDPKDLHACPFDLALCGKVPPSLFDLGWVYTGKP